MRKDEPRPLPEGSEGVVERGGRALCSSRVRSCHRVVLRLRRSVHGRILPDALDARCHPGSRGSALFGATRTLHVVATHVTLLSMPAFERSGTTASQPPSAQRVAASTRTAFRGTRLLCSSPTLLHHALECGATRRTWRFPVLARCVSCEVWDRPRDRSAAIAGARHSPGAWHLTVNRQLSAKWNSLLRLPVGSLLQAQA
jgi:hypothetical protein